jgi:hypothetical protein
VKFKDERPFAEIAAAERKLLELANGLEADAGRLPVGVLNMQFIEAGASVPEYAAAMKAAVDHGYFTVHLSGGYVTFTQAGADLFA